MKGDGHVYKVNCQSCVFSVVSSCFIRLCAVWVRRRDNRILRPRVYVLLRAVNRVLRPSVYVLLRAEHRILRPSVYLLLRPLGVYVLLRAERRILRTIALYDLLRTVSLLLSALLLAALYALVVQRSVASFSIGPGTRESSGQWLVGSG
jgi:hypothetical protein